jgi:glycosyltransferase involved in cell wall biosynthesis
MKVSVLVPTLFPDLARAAIEDLRPQLTELDHEFVVVSPTEIAGERIVWVREENPQGSIVAGNRAFAAASGDVVLVAGDDVRFSKGAIGEALTVFAEPARPTPLAVTFPHRLRALDCVWVVFGRLFPTIFAFGRADAEKAGGYLDPGYRTGCADPDLGLRIWAAGGQVRRARAHVRFLDDRQGHGESPQKTNAVIEKDVARFAAIWRPKFDPIWGENDGDFILQLAAESLRFLSPDPGTLALDGRAAIRDLRIARALTVAAYAQNTTLPADVLEAGLKYFRWAAKLSADPLQIQVAGFYWAGVARRDETKSALPEGFVGLNYRAPA